MSKRKHDDASDDALSADDVSASKRNKTHAEVPKTQVDDDNNPFWSISTLGTRRVTVSRYRGSTFVQIREYYDAGSELKPGKKGIGLTPEQFSRLVELLPQLEKVLSEKGIKLPRPKYEDENDGRPLAGIAANGVDELDDVKKENFEATSEED